MTREDSAVVSQITGEVAHELATRIVKTQVNNFVERPWGGTRIRELKGLCPLPDQARIGGAGLGESFEIAACDDDPEARDHPSRTVLPDGAVVSLPGLIDAHCEALLGRSWKARYGCRIPLLPKILDIRELLSVQGHPPGHTEVYVIIDAEPGATIRLGFRDDVDAIALAGALRTGREHQLALIERLRPGVDQTELQRLLAPWFAARPAQADVLRPEIDGLLIESARRECESLLGSLKACYWQMLDAMNEIAVVPGQIIHNANPLRLMNVRRQARSAEVHALGNPEGKEIVALEIRRPGPTLRAWDNVRFPLRDIDIEAALGVLNLSRTGPEDFLVEPKPLPGRAHTRVSVDSEYFRIEHLQPPERSCAQVGDDGTHCLHNIGAPVALARADGRSLGRLGRGESALVPKAVDGYEVTALAAGAHVVKVTLP